MVNIPMTSKRPIHTSELGQINRRSRQQGIPASQLNRSDFNQGMPMYSSQSAHNQSMPSSQPARSQNASSSQPARSQSVSSPSSAGCQNVPVRAKSGRLHPPVTGTVLQKGQKTSLSQLAAGLDWIEVGLGWELKPGGQGYDLDVEAFLLGSSGKVPGDGWFVFYNQPVSPDSSVRLLETDVSGSSPGDDKTIQIHLGRVSPDVARIAFIVTINEALVHGYNFSNVANAYIRIVDRSAHRELVRFQLTDYYSNVCSMVVGEIYRYKNEWRFNPVGNGTGDDLAGLCRRYGVNV